MPPECRACGADESVDHVLFQCIWARAAWCAAGLPWDGWTRGDQFLRTIRWWSGNPLTRQEAVRATCTTYQIWLARNARTFGEQSKSPRLVAESARAQAAEISRASSLDGLLIARDIWGSPSASAASHTVFFTWEPPPPSFLKVNFDRSVLDGVTIGGAGFVIRDPTSRVVAAGGCQVFDCTIPGAELRAAWAGLRHTQHVLSARSVILEGDSATVISMIQGGLRAGAADHPLIRDIWLMMRDGGVVQAKHVFREANGAADWVATYVANHAGSTLWAGDGELPRELRDVLFSDFIGYIRTCVV
ncbi:uncharacterized protein LOC120110675 [Phoenix dactylifera]|uniref:Uncharacterized protein LOC120110675 n=1 Tax=Phoenix dactylifera TaxID=42345 RepID=A0A8B9A8Z5_PHODC|nr:uncharacterized protein LOC120110675 [Phoenix dactylifera]